MARTDHLEWLDELPYSVTVCDREYVILYMNDESATMNKRDGGRALIGTNLMDCHSPASRKKLRRIMASGKPNIYTTEKKGVRKFVCQSQWKRRGRVGGLVEIVVRLPKEVPNFVRT
jgi:transcriptional regulator with PAS, ATPase and Fis domain